MNKERIDRDRANRLLMALLGSEELVLKWWLSPNRAFDYKTPQQQEELDPRIVANYILSQFHH